MLGESDGNDKGDEHIEENRLAAEIWRPLAKGVAGVNCLIAALDFRGLISAATYLRNAKGELFTVTNRRLHNGVPGQPYCVIGVLVSRQATIH